MRKDEDIVLDELKICYKADKEQLAFLMGVEEGGFVDVEGYRLFRLGNGRFRFFFLVTKEGEPMADLKFGLYSDKDDGQYAFVFFKVHNQVLYNKTRLETVLKFPEDMGFVFNNFTSLDLALDTDRNLITMVRRLMLDKGVTTIYNGRAIELRHEVLAGAKAEYSITLNRFVQPGITLHQKKAITNKNEGITVQVYDKKAEIKQESGKQYILDYYGNPNRLYRMEVRLHYQEIKDYFANNQITPSLDIIFDATRKTELFLYHLASVIRFTRGRRKIPWDGLLKCSHGG